MSEQQLLTDLAVAERNTKGKLKYYQLRFAEEIRDAFTKNNVNTYFDLVRKDLKKALELRELALKENLL